MRCYAGLRLQCEIPRLTIIGILAIHLWVNLGEQVRMNESGGRSRPVWITALSGCYCSSFVDHPGNRCTRSVKQAVPHRRHAYRTAAEGREDGRRKQRI